MTTDKKLDAKPDAGGVGDRINAAISEERRRVASATPHLTFESGTGGAHVGNLPMFKVSVVGGNATILQALALDVLDLIKSRLPGLTTLVTMEKAHD